MCVMSSTPAFAKINCSFGHFVRIVVAVGMAVSLSGSATARPNKAVGSDNPWRVIFISDRTAVDMPSASIHFANGRSFRPGLYSPAVVGELGSPGGPPFLVVDGSDCSECDATARSVYIGDPTAWPTDPSGIGGLRFASYPSRNFSASGRRLMSVSRLFVGECIAPNRSSVVSFTAERDGRSWKRQVDWANLEERRLSKHSAAPGRSAPSLGASRRAVATGRCREVSPQVTNEGDF
jgi:hypothetical protein